MNRTQMRARVKLEKLERAKREKEAEIIEGRNNSKLILFLMAVLILFTCYVQVATADVTLVSSSTSNVLCGDAPSSCGTDALITYQYELLADSNGTVQIGNIYGIPIGIRVIQDDTTNAAIQQPVDDLNNPVITFANGLHKIVISGNSVASVPLTVEVDVIGKK